MSSPRAGTQHLHAVIHDGDGPVAFLTHGALGSRSCWDDNLDALKTVCRPVVIELWGHGRPPCPTGPERYRPLSHVAEFERLADVAVPVLLTNGTEEGRFQHLIGRAKQIPDLEIADLPASHAVNAQDPTGWNDVVTRFIRHHAGSPGTR